MAKKVTIIDLANASGVSKSTISRYLQGKPTTSDKAVRIENAIKSLNYVRNSFARYLRNQEPYLIGVLVPDLDNPFFLKIIKKLDELAEGEGYSLIIKTTKSNLLNEQKALKFIHGYLIKKIILCRSELSEDFVKKLSYDQTIVSIDREYTNIHSVVSDNYKNGYLVTSHLAKVEPGNLMFFAREKENESVMARIQGFKEKIIELNRTVYEYRYGSKYTVDLKRLTDYVVKNDIRGIISRNDNDALKIMTYLNDLSNRGKIGRIRIAGFDNIDLSQRIIPRLTTIDQQIETMCECAFQCLMNEDLIVQNVVQTGELITRESTI